MTIPSRETAIRPAMEAVWRWANVKADATQAEAAELRQAADAMLAHQLEELPHRHEVLAHAALQQQAEQAEDRLALARELVAALRPFMGA